MWSGERKKCGGTTIITWEKNQDSNWGVTVEWPDKLFNTREKMS